MYCKRCRVRMKEEKRSFHKRRKWICPQCGTARMQTPPNQRRGRSESTKHPTEDS